MKRIILFIFIFLLISIYTCTCVRADSYKKYPSSSATFSYESDIYTLEYKEPYNVFRINKNNTSYSEFIINGYTLNKVEMKIINNRLYLFGCSQVKIDDNWNFYFVPVLYIFTLDPSYIGSFEYESCDKTGKLYSYMSSVETIGENTYISIGFNLEKNTVNYYGNYKIIKLDKNLEELTSYSLSSDKINLSKIYDCLVVNKSSSTVYLDKNLKIKNSYNESDTYQGSYVLEADAIVNDEEKVKGTAFSIPGEYIIKEGEYEEKIINIEPIVEINEGTDKVTYKVSGGDVYINGNISTLTGEITEVGEYDLIVKGLGNYEYKTSFKIKEKIEFTFKESYEIGDVLTFTGNAYLNGDEIESGYEITEAGTYILEFRSGDEVLESYEFIVEEELITKDDKKIMYIALSAMIIISILILLIILIVDIVKRRRAKKALYNE